jgi:hypothetical protein
MGGVKSQIWKISWCSVSVSASTLAAQFRRYLFQMPSAEHGEEEGDPPSLSTALINFNYALMKTNYGLFNFNYALRKRRARRKRLPKEPR